MFPYLSIGPFLLQLPGLVLLIGVWVALTLAEKEAKYLRIPATDIYNLVFYGLVSGLVGARLVYAGRYLSVYLSSPLTLFSLNMNTLSPLGGLLFGFAVAFLYGRWKKLPFRPTLDALAPGIAIFMVFFAFANFLSGNGFGAATQLPWAISLWDEYRHPTQVYEFLLALGVFFLIWKGRLVQRGIGLNFLFFLALTSLSRLFLEAFRGDSLLLAEGLRAAQLASLGILLTCLLLMRLWGQEIKQDAK